MQSELNSCVNNKLLVDVLMYSATQHANQRRKNAEQHPYINHPIHVAQILTSAGINDIETLCGALLHDTIEDTGATYDDIEKLFGTNIAKIVVECTDDKKLDKFERKRLQILHVQNEHLSLKAKYIKIADKLSNLSSLVTDPPKNWPKDVITGYAVWSYAVCRHLYGLNEVLDNEMNRLFNNFGVIDLAVDNAAFAQKLENYYETIKE